MFSKLCLLTALCSLALAWPPTSSATAAAPSTSSNLPLCQPRVISLATGIFLNINGQHAELNEVITLQSIESASPLDQVSFEVGKGSLIAYIMGGMSIRSFNQAVAPLGNAALPGLATVAAAQGTELSLTESLTGDPTHDLPILATLNSDIVAGTQQNEYNLGNATEGCSLGFNLTSY